MTWSLVLGDCLDPIRGLASQAPESIDSFVSDPPAGIGFMDRPWDSDRGGRVAWIRWLQSVMEFARIALRPGAHGVAWALPRTSHWTATAIEDAGFEIRDIITHHFGTGYPKSLDVSRAIDKEAGAVRQVVGSKLGQPGYHLSGHDGGAALGDGLASSTPESRAKAAEITAPATLEAAAWAGWGTALKPASEHWILFRKPFTGTVAANVQRQGTGAINVDGCRVDFASAADREESTAKNAHETFGSGARGVATVYGEFKRDRDNWAPEGRFPANLVLSHTEWCEEVGSEVVSGDARAGGERGHDQPGFADVGADARAGAPAGALHGAQLVPIWRCLPGCPVAQLDAQGAGASRFFYTPKPTPAEREADLYQLDRAHARGRLSMPVNGDDQRRAKGKRANLHPTVKSQGLMSWLVRLVTPPGGIVLDPFTGSGSTGVAALRQGFRFIGWELDPDYYRVATARIGAAVNGPLFARARPSVPR